MDKERSPLKDFFREEFKRLPDDEKLKYYRRVKPDLGMIVKDLTPPQKQIVEYLYLGYTYSEIATTMGYKNKSAVSSALKRIRKNILEGID